METTIQPLTGDQCAVFNFANGAVIEMYDPTDIHFDSLPPTVINEGGIYTYAIYTSDSISCNSITLTSEGALPSWLTLTDIGDGTGVLQGVPSIGESGNYAVQLKTEDGGGGYAVQSFTIVVVEVEEPSDDPTRYALGISTFLMFYDPTDEETA